PVRRGPFGRPPWRCLPALDAGGAAGGDCLAVRRGLCGAGGVAGAALAAAHATAVARRRGRLPARLHPPARIVAIRGGRACPRGAAGRVACLSAGGCSRSGRAAGRTRAADGLPCCGYAGRRRLHSSRGLVRYAGQATVERGRNPLARACAWLAGLPPAGEDLPIVVEFECAPGRETWRRRFGAARIASTLRLRGGRLRERLGPVSLRIDLHANEGVIWWTVAGARLLGVVPLPASLFDGVRCREYEREGRYCFEVEAVLPMAGRVIRYAGWLEPA